MRRLLLLLTLFTTLQASAENGLVRLWKRFDNWIEKGQRAGIDTNYVQVPRLNRQVYIGNFAYWQSYGMHMPIYLENASQIVPGLKDHSHYELNAYTWQSELELGLDWKGLALELPIPIRNRYRLSLGLAKNGSVWGARFRYKHLRDMDGSCNIADRSIDRQSNKINIFFVEGYYVLFHRKFSLSAGLYADMVQLRSAGSPLIYANYYNSRYTVSKLFPANYDSFRTNQVSIGAGYAYNLALMRGRLVLHASLVPMFSVYNHLIHRAGYTKDTFFPTPGQSEEAAEAAALAQQASGLTEEEWANFYRAADQGSARFQVNFFARMAVNYSFNRFIVSFLANYRRYGYSNDLDLKILNQEADMQFNFAVRF